MSLGPQTSEALALLPPFPSADLVVILLIMISDPSPLQVFGTGALSLHDGLLTFFSSGQTGKCSRGFDKEADRSYEAL